jgi:hypothetical protein
MVLGRKSASEAPLQCPREEKSCQRGKGKRTAAHLKMWTHEGNRLVSFDVCSEVDLGKGWWHVAAM